MRRDGVNKVPTWEQLGQLPYLSAVIHETLRLRPTAPSLASRLALEADTLPRSDGSHFFIPKVPLDMILLLSDELSVFQGTSIHLDLVAIHRNPAYWSQPDAFLPGMVRRRGVSALNDCVIERFIEGSVVFEADLALRGGKPNTFCYFPFGLGASWRLDGMRSRSKSMLLVGDKSCIGNRFAMAEMLVVLSALFAKYRVTLTPAANVNVRKHTGTIAPIHLEVQLSPITTK